MEDKLFIIAYNLTTVITVIALIGFYIVIANCYSKVEEIYIKDLEKIKNETIRRILKAIVNVFFKVALLCLTFLIFSLLVGTIHPELMNLPQNI